MLDGTHQSRRGSEGPAPWLRLPLPQTQRCHYQADSVQGSGARGGSAEPAPQSPLIRPAGMDGGVGGHAHRASHRCVVLCHTFTVVTLRRQVTLRGQLGRGAPSDQRRTSDTTGRLDSAATLYDAGTRRCRAAWYRRAVTASAEMGGADQVPMDPSSFQLACPHQGSATHADGQPKVTASQPRDVI